MGCGTRTDTLQTWRAQGSFAVDMWRYQYTLCPRVLNCERVRRASQTQTYGNTSAVCPHVLYEGVSGRDELTDTGCIHRPQNRCLGHKKDARSARPALSLCLGRSGSIISYHGLGPLVGAELAGSFLASADTSASPPPPLVSASSGSSSLITCAVCRGLPTDVLRPPWRAPCVANGFPSFAPGS